MESWGLESGPGCARNQLCNLGTLLGLPEPECPHLCNKGLGWFLSPLPVLTILDSTNNHKDAEGNPKAIRFINTYLMYNRDKEKNKIPTLSLLNDLEKHKIKNILWNKIIHLIVQHVTINLLCNPMTFSSVGSWIPNTHSLQEALSR